MKLNIGRLITPLFPSRCACCGVPVEGDESICRDCENNLTGPEPPFCPFCGAGIEVCNCNGEAPYDILVSPFYYEGPVLLGIHRLKFQNKEDSAVFFGRKIGETINKRLYGYEFDILAPVPASRKKLMERGFNQSLSLAEEIKWDNGKKKPILDSALLKKTEGMEVKKEKSRAGRKEMVKGSFLLGKGRDVKGKSILLVDDIMTTGATLGECATILKLHGAKYVAVVCAAVSHK